MGISNGEFRIEDIQIDDEEFTKFFGAGAKKPRNPAQSKPINRSYKNFIRPIPLQWMRRTTRLAGCAAQVSILLWYWSGVKRSLCVRTSRDAVSGFGISSWTLHRGLRALESAGLVKVERRRGCAPVVTLLVLDSEKEG